MRLHSHNYSFQVPILKVSLPQGNVLVGPVGRGILHARIRIGDPHPSLIDRNGQPACKTTLVFFAIDSRVTYLSLFPATYLDLVILYLVRAFYKPVTDNRPAAFFHIAQVDPIASYQT